MTKERARELFSAACEGELDAASQADFDAALGADAALAQEYAAFGRMLALTRDVAVGASGATPGADGGSDVLPRVQRALRERSRGRYYADRFAERHGPGRIKPWLLAGALLALLALAWGALQLFG